MVNEGNRLDALQKAIHVAFRDPSLLQRALTHASYVNENPTCGLGDNERLEFLGDAVCGFVAAEHLYACFPDLQEGQLTELHHELVRSDTLGGFSAQIELGQHLLLGRGEERGGGRTRPALLGNAFEALLGALCLDQGIEAARQFLTPFLRSQLEAFASQGRLRDAKSRLQEWAQATWHETPCYVTVHQAGPDHARQFTVEVSIQGRVYGRGAGHSKQAAEQAAAQAALDGI